MNLKLLIGLFIILSTINCTQSLYHPSIDALKEVHEKKQFIISPGINIGNENSTGLIKMEYGITDRLSISANHQTSFQKRNTTNFTLGYDFLRHTNVSNNRLSLIKSFYISSGLSFTKATILKEGVTGSAEFKTQLVKTHYNLGLYGMTKKLSYNFNLSYANFNIQKLLANGSYVTNFFLDITSIEKQPNNEIIDVSLLFGTPYLNGNLNVLVTASLYNKYSANGIRLFQDFATISIIFSKSFRF